MNNIVIQQEETNLDKFERYVMNNIPIRLIRLSDMKFVMRSDVKSTSGTLYR